MMGWHDGGAWEAAVWLPLCLAALAVWVAVLTVAMNSLRACRAREPAPPEDAARRILEQRYAAGEVEEEDYRRRCEVLAGR